ncbi:MFS transporter [Pseudalkalibacillus salsuginis]|uniref:MFS transporter n=1 Tax=Pseudalkalibacillus salsuginis TaxID=2910972 RepID=UPI001F1F0FE8|nr:MFS transporter [Pseudalkalibacillus salsuginis]MCF6409024.1 MFS transporter [Pseudalkalibacillus salsuginis]
MDVQHEKALPYTKQSPKFWRIILALAVASLLIFSALYIFQPLLPVFVEEFDITPTYSSLLVSSSVITMILGLFVLGFLADRYGRRTIMNLSLIITVATLFAMPFAESFSLIVALRFLQGFFIAGIPAASMGYLGDEIDKQHLSLAMTFYIASNALGGMGGRVFAGYFTDLFSWQTTLLSLSGFGVIVILLFLFLLPEERLFKKKSASLVSDLRGMFVHLTDIRLIPLFIMGLFLQTMFTAIWTYLPFYLHSEPFNWTLKMISFTYFAYALGVLAPPLAGRISPTVGLSRVMFGGLSLLAIGTWLTAIQYTPLILIGLGMICTGFFIAHSMAAALVSRTATHHKSGASSFYLINYYVGVAIGSTAVGKLWDHFAWTGIISTSFLLLIVVIFLPKLKA